MLYLIGLGLNPKGISQEGKNALKKCDKIYLDNYTVDFPYTKDSLEQELERKIILSKREQIENFSLIDQAEKKTIALLIYGNPLVATTHITLVQETKKRNIRIKIIHAASIFDAITETGLQLYKFGKITSMPKWKKSYAPTSFMEIVKQNQTMKAHSLILIDIGLPFNEALKQLEITAKKQKVILEKIIIATSLGTEKQRIIYKAIHKLHHEKISSPFVIIIPSELHFVEKEFLEQ